MTDLDILERKHLQDIGAFERKIALMASQMTLAEVNAELLRLPASPQNDRDLLARCAMMKRRHEILEAQRKPPREVDQAPIGDMCDVIVPPGYNVSCVQSRTIRGKYFYVEMRGDNRVIRMPWSEFYSLAFATHTGTAGVNGAVWLESNPSLVARLPRNLPPPLPESPR
jgi:hypothetical protein